jgi:Rod binding domain-containing protein
VTVDPIATPAAGPAPAAAAQPDSKLLTAAKGFEQLFVSTLVQQLQETTQLGGDDSGDDSGDDDPGVDAGAGGASLGPYQGLVSDALARALTGTGGLGLADQLASSIEKSAG